MTDEVTKPTDDAAIRLRYVGKRFDGARLPLDVLLDLPAFRDLLVAFARQEWRTVNSGRQRVPKGFDRSLTFDLSAIEEGSAIPLLRWDRESAQNYLPGFAGELEEIVESSLGNIVNLFDDAANDKYPKALSSEHVRALNKFGASLRDDEKIEFFGRHGKDGKVVFLNNVTRKNLITKVRESYQTRFEGTGLLVGVFAHDESSSYIEVSTESFGVIRIHLERERVTGEFDGNIGSSVEFDLQIELDNNDAFKSVVDVHDLVLIDEKIAAELEKCKHRLSDLQALPANWDDDGGLAIDARAIQSASKFLVRRPHFCSEYKIYPTSLGGVIFEFEVNGWDLSIEFLPSGAVEIFGIEVETNAELPPILFDEVGPDLAGVFDKHVGRDGK